jgi:F0F1-type ATP synthase assembly protein I
MIETGQRKVEMLKLVLSLSLVVVLALAAATIWGPAIGVSAAIGPIALMWGGVAASASATFNIANGTEHTAAATAQVAQANSAAASGPTA